MTRRLGGGDESFTSFRTWLFRPEKPVGATGSAANNKPALSPELLGIHDGKPDAADDGPGSARKYGR